MHKLRRKMHRSVTVLFLIGALGWGVAASAVTYPNDPDYFLAWHLDTIQAPAAWDITTGSPEVVVAVLDTGLDLNHPDIVPNLWTNPGEIPGDGIDNDHNGFVDDVHGYDFVDTDPDPSPNLIGGYAAEALNHGTIVAGIIAAASNNLRGITGVAWKVKIMPVRVLDNYGFATIEPTIHGIDYAVANGALVINLSFQGQTPHPTFESVLERAYRSNVVVVGAAGNGSPPAGAFNLDTTPFYPVCYRTATDEKLVIGVGATNQADERSSFSNYGSSCVDVMAPGDMMYSTQINYGADAPGLLVDYSGGWRGTSLATPVVSGVTALIKSINQNFTPAQVRSFIRQTADDISLPNPTFVGELGAGRVNAARAVAAAAEYQRAHPTPTKATLKPRIPESGFVLGAGSGQAPEVVIVNSDDTIAHHFLAYSKTFRGGVAVAVGDVDGDGEAEIVTAAGRGGGPHIRVFTPSGNLESQFFADDKNFRGGVTVAVGDVDGDGEAEIVTAPQSGLEPRVRVWNARGELEYEFFAYSKTFRGGVAVAVGDVDGDGKADIVTTPNAGGGPQVRIFNAQGRAVGQFFAYSKTFRGGVAVAVGDVDGDGEAEIVTVARTGASLARVFTNRGVQQTQWTVGSGLAVRDPLVLAVGDIADDGTIALMVGGSTQRFGAIKQQLLDGQVLNAFPKTSRQYATVGGLAILSL